MTMICVGLGINRFFPFGVDKHTAAWLSTWWVWPWCQSSTWWFLPSASGLHSSPGRRRRNGRPSCWPTATSAGWLEPSRCQVIATSINKHVHMHQWPLTPTHIATSEGFGPRSGRKFSLEIEPILPDRMWCPVLMCSRSFNIVQGRPVVDKETFWFVVGTHVPDFFQRKSGKKVKWKYYVSRRKRRSHSCCVC